MDLFNYSRRETSEVNIGATPMGGSNPIRIQSMTNTATQDTEASVAQAKRIVDAGGEYVRLTAQGIKEAENLMNSTVCRESTYQSGKLCRCRTHLQASGIYRRRVCTRVAEDT